MHYADNETMGRYSVEYTRDVCLGDEAAIDELRLDAWNRDHARELAEKALSSLRFVTIVSVRALRPGRCVVR